MGQFASSVGLVSGINSAEIIDQLISIERRGVDRVQDRNAALTETQTALNEVSARLLSIGLDAGRLARPTTFQGTTAASSDEAVATATSSAGATAGDYQISVSRLVSSQQTVSRGFADAGTQPVSTQPRLLAFSRNGGRLTAETPLEALNGGRGIERGQVKIIDHTQKTRTVDLTGVASLQEAADRINELTLAVKAEVVGGGLTVSNLSNLSQTNERSIRLFNVGAADVLGSLGLDAEPVDGEIVGRDLNVLGRETDLASLRDGRGVRFGAGADLTLTTAGGGRFEVDLSGAATLGEVFDRIDEATEGAVAAGVRPDGRGIELTDRTSAPGGGGSGGPLLPGQPAAPSGGGGGGFGVEGALTSGALEGLGLAGADAAGGVITGERVRGGLNSKLLGPAFGGRGLAALGGEAYVPIDRDTALAGVLGGPGPFTGGSADPDVEVTTADGEVTGVDLDGLETLGEVVDAANEALGGRATFFLQDDRVVVADHTRGDAAFGVRDVEAPGGPGAPGSSGSSLAAELGLAAIARGGTAVGRLLLADGPERRGTQIQITNAAGRTTGVDFAGVETAEELIDRINDAGAGVRARLNGVGDGVSLEDRSGGDGPLRVQSGPDGVLAEQLGLAGEFRGGRVRGRSLQFGFADANTSLESLGVAAGRFSVQDSDGRRGTIDLTEGVAESGATLGDVVAQINAQGIALTARVNDTGDGLLLEDTGGGGSPVEVLDLEGTTAAGLRVAGTFEGARAVDGSLRTYVASGPEGTLRDLAQAISDSDAGVSATVVDDGSPGRPFRLSLTGSQAGAAFGFTLDDGGLNLRAENLSEARDALAFVGGAGAGSGVAVTSGSNQLVGVVPGATIDLLQASETPVTVTIAADTAAVTEAVTAFVEGFNELATRLDELDSFDAETETRGVLLGDPTVARVRSTLYNAVINPNAGLPGPLRSLSDVGVTVGSGALLELDAARLEAAFAEDPQAVQELFGFGAAEAAEAATRDPDDPAPPGPPGEPVFGIAVEIDQLLDGLTDVRFGSVQGRIDTLDTQIRQNNDRIDRLNETLDRRREQLQLEFAGLESVLAGFQDQSSSLTTLQQLSSQARG